MRLITSGLSGVVKEMPEGECRTFLGGHRVGVMSLARAGDAYGLPLFYGYDGQALYFHSRPGEKDEFLQATGNGCFVVLEVHSDDDWTSVEARGPVQKVDTNADADRAFKAISENPFPVEFGIDVHGGPLRSGKGAYLWMMRPKSITGRKSKSGLRSTSQSRS